MYKRQGEQRGQGGQRGTKGDNVPKCPAYIEDGQGGTDRTSPPKGGVSRLSPCPVCTNNQLQKIKRWSSWERKMDSNQELELFKRDINLVNFILGQGFSVDSSKSDRRTTVLRSGSNKVLCWKAASSDWMFHDLRSGRSGTILDWTRYEQGLSLGHARKALRAFLGSSPPKPLPSHHALSLIHI